MTEVHITEYVRPNGDQREIKIDVSNTCARWIEELQEMDFHVSVEEIGGNGDRILVFYIADDDNEIDVVTRTFTGDNDTILAKISSLPALLPIEQIVAQRDAMINDLEQEQDDDVDAF